MPHATDERKSARAQRTKRNVASERRPSASSSKQVSTRDRLLAAAVAEFAQHGFSGARVERILSKARANPRMLYHHFGGKAGIYVSVLEEALADLRRHELSLDVDRADPLDGLLQLFDFMNDHFESHPTLVSLFTNENLLKARFMRTSARIKEMSSPVLAMIARFVLRGSESGRLAAPLDPLRVYVLMVALCQFHLSNVHTLSVIFDQDLTAATWREARKADARRMLESFLRAETPHGNGEARKVSKTHAGATKSA